MQSYPGNGCSLLSSPCAMYPTQDPGVLTSGPNPQHPTLAATTQTQYNKNNMRMFHQNKRPSSPNSTNPGNPKSPCLLVVRFDPRRRAIAKQCRKFNEITNLKEEQEAGRCLTGRDPSKGPRARMHWRSASSLLQIDAQNSRTTLPRVPIFAARSRAAGISSKVTVWLTSTGS